MILPKDELANFIAYLQKEHEVFAPVRKGSYSVFQKIGSAAEIDLTFINSKIPPKGVLFPSSEKLFSYRVDKDSAVLEDHIDAARKVIFGIRPCDARGLALIDNVFNNDKYQDPYYLTRRANTVLIGVGCSQPAPTCFCTSMGCGPFSAEGLDILLTDTGNAYVVEPISDKGRELLAGSGLAAASNEDKARAEAVKQAAVVSCQVATEGLKEKLDVNFEDPMWDFIHEKCLGCGACTYSCPTCHCFDIVDEAVDCNGCRVRNWDSCMYPLFTLHGSGHNPRPTGKERFRQRIMHKFRYFVDNFGAMACVGCGRCVKICPVNIDVREVIAEIRGAEARSEQA